MTVKSGKIGVTTENIFPIIKKFLYSDHEIFLRELISNAVDATQKLRTLKQAEEFKGELGDETIRVDVDKNAGTLTIRDAGVGMTLDEVEQYINQIALSGAAAFLDKYKESANTIIGHFGLGFYSAFMVSNRVEIDTLSWKDGAEGVHWSCEGDPEYEVTKSERSQRGTDIILHISEDNKEFLEESRIQELLEKYCRFMPVPITLGKKKKWEDGKQVETDEDNLINLIAPIWTKRPADLKDEDYAKFYNALYPMADEPLFHIHLNVDYPFNLSGILYFPKLKSNFDIQRNRIQLFCNQVFVTDSVEGIVPEYLTLLHGVLDSPDIPLNVSRSYLQQDQQVKKIAGHITKKVSDRLQDLFKEDRMKFEEKWDDLKLFITFGMVTDEKFYERAADFMLLKNVDGKYFTLKEYRELIAAEQTDKSESVVYLYATDAEAQWSYIEQARAKGYDVLLLDGQLDAHLINQLEQKIEKTRFARVDADTIDRLIRKDDAPEVSLSEEAQATLRGVMEGVAEKGENRIVVSFQELGENALPAMITRNEFMRRMHDIQSMSPTNPMFGNMPQSLELVLNASHPLVKKMWGDAEIALGEAIAKSKEALKPLEEELKEINTRTKDLKPEDIPTADKDRREELYELIDETREEQRDRFAEYGKENTLVGQIYDLALLSNNELKGEALAAFVRRSVKIITEANKG